MPDHSNPAALLKSRQQTVSRRSMLRYRMPSSRSWNSQEDETPQSLVFLHAPSSLQEGSSQSSVWGTASAGLEAERQTASLGPDLWNKTYYPSGADANSIIKPWYTVDAEGQTLGRLAVLVANTIRQGACPSSRL